MADAKPPAMVDLEWTSGLTFTARAGPRDWVLDGRGEAGPSPVTALASALAGCMAIDVVHILTRGRFDVRSLSARLTGHRADSDPRRLTAVELHFVIATSAPAEKVDRAIALSRERYCSVWHSLRQDIEFSTSVALR